MRLRFWVYIVCVTILMNCSDNGRVGEGLAMPESDVLASGAQLASENPFLRVSQLQMSYPEFNLIRSEHYLPAFELGMKEH